MFSLKGIRNKFLKGDFTGLFGHSKGDKNLHPAEVLTLFQTLPDDIAIKAFTSFPPTTQVKVFPYLNTYLQKKIVYALPQSSSSQILNQLSSDDRLEFYSKLKGIELTSLLDYLNENLKTATHDLLGYPDQSVARLINTDFAAIEPGMTIQQANEHLRQNQHDSETANVIYVVDKEGKLLDDIPVRRLVLNEPSKKIEDILDGYCVRLLISDSKDDAIDKFKRYDRTVLPVTNDVNVLLGVVTVDDVLDVEEQKSTREMQKFGGVEQLDYPYVKTPFFSLIRKRAGWLIVLFLGEMLTATAMGYFDKEISNAIVLALFVPLIISSGGNSSISSNINYTAMALKELSIKDWWYVMRREILSGLTLGVVLGTIGFLRISLWQKIHWFNYGKYWFLIAITIFFSLIGIVMWGTITGSMIPILLKKLKIDPATSSAPFVATLVDVTGLIIYFSIAAVILKGTLL